MSVISAFALGVLAGSFLVCLGAWVGAGTYHKALASHIKGYRL